MDTQACLLSLALVGEIGEDRGAGVVAPVMVGITTIGTEDTVAATPTTVIGATTDMEGTGMDTNSPLPSKNWAAIPENIQAIRKFPKPHEDLFNLAETIPYWWQLANSVPALAFMLARCWCFDGLPKEGFIERVKKYVLHKRTEICEVMGFPADKRTVRLLIRFHISPEEQTPCLIADLKILRMLLHWEPSSYDILEQCERFDIRQISLLSTGIDLSDRPTWMIQKYHFWMSLSVCEWFFRLPSAKRSWLVALYRSAAMRYEDVLIQAFLDEVPPLSHFRNERKTAALLKPYLQKAKAINIAKYRVMDNVLAWPEPPIEPCDGLFAIPSYAALACEASEMHHCIESYANRIFLGSYYAYRMELPRRCTVGIRFHQDRWQIEQVRGKHNEEITDSVIMTALDHWLSNSSTRDIHRTPQLDYLKEISKRCGIPLRK